MDRNKLVHELKRRASNCRALYNQTSMQPVNQKTDAGHAMFIFSEAAKLIDRRNTGDTDCDGNTNLPKGF